MNMLPGNSQTTFVTTGKKREQTGSKSMTVSSVIKVSVNILCGPLCLSENSC